MKMRCVDGHWHNVSPTALLLFVQAMLDGETVKINAEGVKFSCIKIAITPERVAEFQKKYKKNVIAVDGEIYRAVKQSFDNTIMIALPEKRP